MNVKKGTPLRRKRKPGGFNPMNGGYSADYNITGKDTNGVTGKDAMPSTPKPPKGGTGEAEIKRKPIQELAD